jgi:hypothetical protein
MGGRWTKDHYEFLQGTLGGITTEYPGNKRRYTFRADHVAPEKANDDFIRWLVPHYAAEIEALLVSVKGTTKQGIIQHRLNELLKALDAEFGSDSATLKKRAANLKKLKERFHRAAARVTPREEL